MSGTGYDNAQGLRTYRFPAITISAAAVVGRLIGPAGKRGRVIGAEYIVTTGVTSAAGVMTIDTNAGLTSPFSFSVEVASANAGGSATRTELAAQDVDAELPADTVVEIQAGGQPAAGAIDLALTIQWY